MENDYEKEISELGLKILTKLSSIYEFQTKEEFSIVLLNAYDMVRDDETVSDKIRDAYNSAVLIFENLSWDDILFLKNKK